ncbi:hypothetical protein E4U60_003935 [Claviceps pazoutovae]|uniref:Uncharacterized protein n=1 Tax=Claviceps pazoutovae TaxID=1649127 RepID=A0A9P7M9L3_9HYPO|nr:hypothetical protein E4U60_003935 [Claviceps pazoutovae]
MLSNDRLYIALYARGARGTMPGGEDDYNWAFIVGPKSEGNNAQGVRHRAKEVVEVSCGEFRSFWDYEERETSMAPSAMIMVRILIGKVKRRGKLAAVLRTVPLRAEKKPGWNGVHWIHEALLALMRWNNVDDDIFERSGYELDWDTIKDQALSYVARKRAEHRFDGKAKPGTYDSTKVPTWNLLKNVEETP